MKNYKEIEQGTPEWHEAKWGKIGGTLSKGLFVKSDTLLIDILSQRLEEFEYEESFLSDAMERGKEMEPFAIEYLEKYCNVKFDKTGWLQCEENELLGISPDGISEDETIACECKCFGRKKHMEILLENDIPSENIFQLIHYFTVNPKLEKLYFISFRPEAVKSFIKILTPESIVNIGTNAKPKMTKISDCVIIAKHAANELLQSCILKEKELKEF